MSGIEGSCVIEETEMTELNRAVALFQFIRELNKLKQKAILNMKDYQWSFALSNMPNDPENIHVLWCDHTEDESVHSDSYGESTLLSVHKPEFQKCPEPDEAFKDWLISDWDDYRKQPEVKESILQLSEKNMLLENLLSLHNERKDEHSEKTIEIFFADDEERTNSYKHWLEERSVWAEKQKIIAQTRDLFTGLYQLYFELQRESETEEIICANGILCDRDNPSIKHPVLTHRVKLDYDANDNTVYVLDTDAPSELYSIVFQMMEDINLAGINSLSADLQKNDYHPLDRNDTPAFLKVLAHQLTSDSTFSDSGIPDNWTANNRLLLYLEPCYIVRKRLDGTLKAIEQIIENVQETEEVPAPIADIVSGGTVEVPDDEGTISIEEQLASVGGESLDILLSKEANKEQLEIARRIELYNAVLVQGPPGTGKTHTIANLMGHFLAQGKSVLVTSHTSKALAVLKDKVDPGLQNLCVSILDDSNVDMERSIDGITSYMSKTTSHELKREMDTIAIERRDIINRLADVRRKIFAIINQENSSIVYNGEAISPSKAAEFVLAHTEDLSYIPGKVRMHTPLPLSNEQLMDLYRTNEWVNAADEEELATYLPDPKQIMSPHDFENIWNEYQAAVYKSDTISKENNLKVYGSRTENDVTIEGAFGSFAVHNLNKNAINQLMEFINSFDKTEKWMKIVAVDGKKGGSYKQRWETLIKVIQKTNHYAESLVSEQFGNSIQFTNPENKSEWQKIYEELRCIFAEKGKVSRFTLMRHKEYGVALEAVTINGRQPTSAQDCSMILHQMELDSLRKQCAIYWDELLAIHDVPKFFDLDMDNQERVAGNWIPYIQKYLNWYQDTYQSLLEKLEFAGVPDSIIFEITPLDSDFIATDKILAAVEKSIPAVCDLLLLYIDIEGYRNVIEVIKNILHLERRKNSKVCTALVDAIENGNIEDYAVAYADLDRMYLKYDIQKRRQELLKVIEPIAAQWAEAIRERTGIHGNTTMPSDIEEAWKWKQLCGIVEEITAKPLSELQADSIRLSKEYRKITARYAEKSGWYHLLRRTEADISMKQALQGWKQTVKSIGKGTGKQAPALKAKARELMKKCQTAVPGWIMPMNRALESLNPKNNKFDIIIIDEASQSDISALAILYMGKKLIIVGDDKQVSPMAVGIEVDKMNALEQMFIQDKIPNSHLYKAKTSIYDIAATTFQPLMLREHFRCVPEIIGFSNMLSYDNKIKPLRDASNSTLLPAVVNYRVKDGKRNGGNKTNTEEAKAIIALMQACMEQPEYAGKSFGIISLLGDEQVNIIRQMVYQKIDPKEIVARKILCGNSAHFQGDERDVVFLSLVDSGDGNGPIHMMNFGPDDSYRKRYNVAVSRARDQLWVVDSLDPANDLKPGDIRKILIDYSINPRAIEIAHTEVEEHSESPFESAVAKSLVARGYHLIQQWKVGAYRLDIVAVCDRKTVAIECDGERWHSGEAKIREDMERQTILERLGWRFIRIRGSEYFRNPEKTMERVINELHMHGIEPEEAIIDAPETRNTELLNRVKNRASIILYGEQKENSVPVTEIIETALTSKHESISDSSTEKVIIDNVPAIGQAEHSPKDNKKETTLTQQKEYIFPQYPEKKDEPTSATIVQGNPSIKLERNDVGVKQQSTLTERTEQISKQDDIITILKKNNVKYVDKRQVGGALWIIGAEELKPIVSKARSLGINFKYKAGGGKVTKGKDAWWCK